MPKYHEITTKEAILTLKSDLAGLSSLEAKTRLNRFGPNKLPEQKPKSYFNIFFSQFKSPLIYILFAAGVTVFFLDEMADAVVIFFVLLFNAFIGTIQEGKAQNTLFALKKFVETKATVLRDGKENIIPDIELVPGDVVILEEGDKVPADLRIIRSNNLRIDEAALTGESEPVYKISEAIRSKKITIADQKNMAFKGTHVVYGNGVGLVSTTGINTQIGKISVEIASEIDGSPLKESIGVLSKLIIWTVSIISTLLFVGGLLRGESVKDMFTTVVALAISIIPEGLPIVMTLILATGVWRMTKRNALVKKLQAVEALGQARIIAVDKTGTITKNEMIVKKAYFSDKFYDIDGDGYNPTGKILLEGNELHNLGEHLNLFLKLNVLSSNARIAFSPQLKNWIAIGDPTQAAMVCFGQKFGWNKEELEITNPRIAEIPFDYKVKYHIVANTVGLQTISTIAGAPEVLISLSNKIYMDGHVNKLNKSNKEELRKAYEEMAAKGLRVVGLGYKKLESSKQLDNKDFIFTGFIGIEDTIRSQAKKALKEAENAGMKVVMITGDNRLTAKAIAKQVGIYKKNTEVLSGDQIDSMSDDELSGSISNVSVFARVNPEHKLRVIKAYKTNGEIIAMTGDGVNDAPSLIAADLGVAMGKIGTEVAKQAADIVLLDDNFGSIVAAIDEGRNIYKTIKKVILYLFSTSLGELLTIAAALFLGLPLPLLATQIIWLNFVTDGFLDISLAMEPKDASLLKSRFYKPKKYLLDGLMVQRMFVMAIPMAIASLFLFKGNYQVDIVRAWTLTLTLLAVFQWFNAWNCRHETKSIFQMNPFSNKYLVLSTFIVFFLQILAVYNPFMQRFLHTTALNLNDWLIIVLLASSVVVVEEIRKFIARRLLTP